MPSRAPLAGCGSRSKSGTSALLPLPPDIQTSTAGDDDDGDDDDGNDDDDDSDDDGNDDDGNEEKEVALTRCQRASSSRRVGDVTAE